ADADVPLESLTVPPRQRAVEIVGDELHELLAGEVSHRLRPDMPRAPRAPSTARGAGALVDSSRRSRERYALPRSSSLRRLAAGSPAPAAAAAARSQRRSRRAPRGRGARATARSAAPNPPRRR